MRILVLTPGLYDTSPGQRFRIEQWMPYWQQEGFQIAFCPFEDEALHHVLYQPGRYGQKAALMLRGFRRRLDLTRTVRRYDLVFLYREACLAGPAIIERLVARTGVPIVYDFDDPIWMPYRSPNNGLFSYLKFPRKTAHICGLASAVLVGNSLLASWASRYAANVHVIPSTVEMAQYPLQPVNNTGREVTLGWTGSHSTLPFLRLLERPLRRLAECHRFRFLVISHTATPALDFLPPGVVAKQWRADTEALDLREIDIGLAPFPDMGWTPWRCHGKVLQYMAAGIPTVASRIGILPEYIVDGEEGFLATTEDEWVQRLATLLNNPSLRQQMGARARNTVQQRYAAHVWAPRVGALLESLAGSRCR
jgi:hypothetical protein